MFCKNFFNSQGLNLYDNQMIYAVRSIREYLKKIVKLMTNFCDTAIFMLYVLLEYQSNVAEVYWVGIEGYRRLRRLLKYS